MSGAYDEYLKCFKSERRGRMCDTTNVKDSIAFTVSTYLTVAEVLPQLRDYRVELKKVFPRAYDQFCEIWEAQEEG